jgi:hypothetical protein
MRVGRKLNIKEMKTTLYLILTIILIGNIQLFGQSFHIKGKKSNLFFDDQTYIVLTNPSDSISEKGINEIRKSVIKMDNETSLNSTEQKTTQLGFGGGDLNGQIYAELINDYFISKNGNYLGSLIFGSVVSNSDSSKTLNNFFNGGGNFFLKYSFVKDFGKEDGNFTIRNILSLRTSANLPKTKDIKEPISNLNFESSEEFILGLATANDKIEILLNTKAAIATGSQDFTKEFLEMNDNKKYPKAFVYLQMNLGLRITDKYLINVGFKPLVSGNLNENFTARKWNTIGFQLLF